MKLKKSHIWILVFLYIIFIFSNSLTIGEVSGHMSGNISRMLLSLVNRTGFTIEFELFHHYIRKAAHFSEYAALGMLTVFAIHYSSALRRKTLFFAFMTIVPAMDETIQLFVKDRAGAITDCLIDMSGYLAGALVMYILLLIYADIRKKLSHQ